MQKDGNNNWRTDEDKLSRKGETIYYFGTLIFVAGIILIGFATASIVFFQIHYRSDAKLIVDTVTYMGVGLLCILFGINLMVRQSKKGYFIFSIGSLFTLLGIGLFYKNYESNFFYPMVSYIILSYLLGFLLLMGNVFGHVTLWIIRKNKETEQRIVKQSRPDYTDEQIKKDIDEALKKSKQQAADQLQFNLDIPSSFKVSAAMNTETIVKRKDEMNETLVLQQTLTPGSKDEWGGAGIDKAAGLLADALTTESSHKKRFFRFFHGFFSKK